MCICLDWYKWEVGLDLSYDIKEEVLEEEKVQCGIYAFRG